MQQSGLTKDYGSDKVIYKAIRRLMALAYVESARIPEVFHSIPIPANKKIHSIFTWFEANYVSERARFKPTNWSIFRLKQKQYPHTTNSAEAYHKDFNSGPKHPGILTLIQKFKEEEEAMREIKLKVDGGQVFPCIIRKKDAEREQRVRNVFDNKENFENAIKYLDMIATNLKKY